MTQINFSYKYFDIFLHFVSHLRTQLVIFEKISKNFVIIRSIILTNFKAEQVFKFLGFIDYHYRSDS